MTNNFEIIRPFLNWNNEDEYYFLQIIQRKKDAVPGTKVNGTNNNSRLIKAYYVKSLEYLEFIEPEGDKIICEIPSKSGVHLITKPFRLDFFKELYPSIDVVKNNPTNLYIS